MAKISEPGHRAAASGEFEVHKPRAGITGKERSGVGKALPIPKLGNKYVLVTKSGGFIIPSPAESSTTRDSWSKAFKKNDLLCARSSVNYIRSVFS